MKVTQMVVEQWQKENNRKPFYSKVAEYKNSVDKPEKEEYAKIESLKERKIIEVLKSLEFSKRTLLEILKT